MEYVGLEDRLLRNVAAANVYTFGAVAVLAAFATWGLWPEHGFIAFCTGAQCLLYGGTTLFNAYVAIAAHIRYARRVEAAKAATT